VREERVRKKRVGRRRRRVGRVKLIYQMQTALLMWITSCRLTCLLR
jgi:hypothetical protein